LFKKIDFHRDFEQGEQGAGLFDNAEKLTERVFASDDGQEEHVHKEMADVEGEQLQPR
jgi:hypothetical protein